MLKACKLCSCYISSLVFQRRAVTEKSTADQILKWLLLAHPHKSSLGLVRVLRVSLRGAFCFARAGMSTSHADTRHSRIQV